MKVYNYVYHWFHGPDSAFHPWVCKEWYPTKTLYAFLIWSWCATCQSHLFLDIIFLRYWWNIQMVKILVHSYASLYHVTPVRCKYSPCHPVRKHSILSCSPPVKFQISCLKSLFKIYINIYDFSLQTEDKILNCTVSSII